MSRAVNDRLRGAKSTTARAAALCVALAGCAGGGVEVRGSTVVGDDLSYAFGPVPERWRRIHVESNDAAWFDPDTAGTIHVDHTCDRSQDTPLAALVQHLLIGFTQREVVSEETIPFDRREARHVVVRASLDGVPRTMELYVMKRDGCVFDLGYAAPPARFDRGQADFTAFARGFAVRRSPMDRP